MAKILNTRGAAAYLGISIPWVHKLVETGKITAYIYAESGELVKRPKGAKKQGAGLFFYESDLKRYTSPSEPARQRRYTVEQKQEVLRLHSTGLSNREIARQTGISFQSVNNWVKQEQEQTGDHNLAVA